MQEMAEEYLGPAIAETLALMAQDLESADAALLAGVEAQTMVAQAARAAAARDPKAFRFALDYPLRRVVDAVLRRQFPHSPDLRFLFAEEKFVRLQFRGLFQRHEAAPTAPTRPAR